MKGTKSILVMLILFFLGCQKVDLPTFADEGLSYVRFSLVLDKEGKPVADNSLFTGQREVGAYHHQSLDTLRIPVLLSSADRSADLQLDFSVASTREQLADDLYKVLPENRQLTFPAGVSSAFVSIVILRPWLMEEEVVLDLKLESVSDPSIKVGYPRAEEALDELQVSFGGGAVAINEYTFANTGAQLRGEAGETIDFRVNFSQNVLTSELGEMPVLFDIKTTSLCDAVFDYAYALDQRPIEAGENFIQYRFTLAEDIPEEVVTQLTFLLRSDIHPRHQLLGIAAFTLKHAAATNRPTIDAASAWYNLDDPVHRTFGYAWYFSPTENDCKWQKYFALTQAVPVSADHPFNNGNGYHRYKVSFLGTNVGTNPFNMRRYYGGASVSSPAYSLLEGLEFFPENEQSGLVQVVAQNLSFERRSDGQTVVIPMCGGGNYRYRPEIGGYEMYLEVQYDESGIGGAAAVVHQIYLYSFDYGESPPPLTQDCVPYLELQ